MLAAAEEALGAAGRHPAVGAHAAKLRFRPRAYSYRRRRAVPRPLRQADRRLGRRRQVAASTRVVGAAGAGRCSSPVMLAVALAIKLDSQGPVLFRQKRYGFNNELIEVFKFRSMYADQADANAAKLVTKGDPRVTRVGRFIRKTSLDELPQLFNVLQRRPVAGRPAPARAAGQGRRPALRARSSTATSPATASSPASPAGRRSTAGAARPTRRRRSSSASSTTSTTSRTGRCCSTSTSSS